MGPHSQMVYDRYEVAPDEGSILRAHGLIFALNEVN